MTGNGAGLNSSKVAMCRSPGVGPSDVRENLDVSCLRALDVDCAGGAVENSAMEEEGKVV